jgi:hypothetical protein
MERRDAPRCGPRELHYWCYQPYNQASDGSRSVVVCDGGACVTLMVVDRDGAVIDGMCMEFLRDYAGNEDARWVALG